MSGSIPHKGEIFFETAKSWKKSPPLELDMRPKKTFFPYKKDETKRIETESESGNIVRLCNCVENPHGTQ